MAIDDYENSVIIDSLNNLRNKLIADGRYTDAVDELIVKFAHALIKKFKIKMTEVKYNGKDCFEQMGGTYEQQGDYLIPCLTLPTEEEKSIGIWGQRHLRYLKTHRKITYINLLTSGKLNSYLADIDEQAEDMLFRLVKQMAEREGVTEKLKAENQMEWVRLINNICNRAAEIVTANLIYN